MWIFYKYLHLPFPDSESIMLIILKYHNGIKFPFRNFPNQITISLTSMSVVELYIENHAEDWIYKNQQSRLFSESVVLVFFQSTSPSWPFIMIVEDGVGNIWQQCWPWWWWWGDIWWIVSAPLSSLLLSASRVFSQWSRQLWQYTVCLGSSAEQHISSTTTFWVTTIIVTLQLLCLTVFLT